MLTEAKWLTETWADELKAVLQFLTGEDWTARVSGPESGSSTGGYLWWSQDVNVAPDAQISIGAPALAWSELGARVLQAAGVDLIEQSSAKSTYLEAVQQASSGLMRPLSEKLSRVVESGSGHNEAPSHTDHMFEVVLSSGGFDVPGLIVVPNAQLCAAFAEPAAAPPKLLQETALVSAASQPANVSVLLDVQMPVSLCFGKASLALREIMKLTTGSAVELDRKPGDEVDIIVNNCVIARGEVVVIDGNYGVRVTGIVSREQRLALRAGMKV